MTSTLYSTFNLIFYYFLLNFYSYLYLCIFSCVSVTYNCTVHGADLTYISLLVIFCIIVYVTNTNLETERRDNRQLPNPYPIYRYICVFFLSCLLSLKRNTTFFKIGSFSHSTRIKQLSFTIFESIQPISGSGGSPFNVA